MNSKPLETLIAEAKAIAEQATPGPWTAKHPSTDVAGNRSYDSISVQDARGDFTIPDGDFIAFARTALPRYIEALELAIEQRVGINERFEFRCAQNTDAPLSIQKRADDSNANLDQAIAAKLSGGTKP